MSNTEFVPIYCQQLNCLEEQTEQCSHCKLFFCNLHQKNHVHDFMNEHNKLLNAELGNKEFDPTKEKHHFGFVVKAINPGCTVEMQIEDSEGTVTRITSTESRQDDYNAMYAAVNHAFNDWFKRNIS